MKNIAELKNRIANHENPDNNVSGFVCIGYGSYDGLTKDFDIWSNDLWTWANGDNKKNLRSNWNGTMQRDLYYVTVEYATKHNLLYSLDAELADAKDKVGKLNSGEYTTNATVHDYVSWSYDIVSRKTASNHTLQFMNKHGIDHCVVMIVGAAQHIPSEVNVESIPEFETVVLNSNHTAKVYKDRIEVGCQTFSLNILEELIQARAKMEKR